MVRWPLSRMETRDLGALKTSVIDLPCRQHEPRGFNGLTGDIVITDPADPKFDLEKLLLKVAKENP